MRFLLLFGKFLLWTLVLAIVVAVVGREAVLYWVGSRLVRDVKSLHTPMRFQAEAKRCLGGQIGGQVVDGYQVRFLDNRSYQVEVVCAQSQPEVVVTRLLPYGVRKTTGPAGFFADAGGNILAGEATISWFGQNKRVALSENSIAVQSWGKASEDAVSVVTSSCSAHGKQCCDVQTQEGSGTFQDSEVNDCPGQCFQQCLRRPLLLSFQSDPALDTALQVVPLALDNPNIIFSYAFDDTESRIRSITLDFGDGTTQALTEVNGQVPKEYQCSAPPCLYTATIMAQDERGISSGISRIGSLAIQVGP